MDQNLNVMFSQETCNLITTGFRSFIVHVLSSPYYASPIRQFNVMFARFPRNNLLSVTVCFPICMLIVLHNGNLSIATPKR